MTDIEKSIAKTVDYLHKNKEASCVLTLLFVVILLIIFLLTPRAKDVVVNDVGWEYTIQIEKYKQVEHDDWYLPAGAELIRTNREIRSWETVIDHYKEVKKSREVYVGRDEDGRAIYKTEYYKEKEPVYEDVPVYDTKYYYKVWEWVHERNIVTYGLDHNPYYGEVVLYDNERQGRSIEEYFFDGFVLGTEKMNHYVVKDRSIWEKLKPDTTIHVKIRLGTIVEFIEY